MHLKKVKSTIVAATVIGSMMMSLPVMADNTFRYGTINGEAASSADCFSFEKDFQMNKDTTIPAATFSYSVAPGAAIAATASTPAVKAGTGTPTIADVVYAANEQASANMTVSIDGNTKTATKIAKVDMSSATFSEPGIYRYIVTESGTNQGVTNDPILTRTLDVYVVNKAAVDGVTEAWIYDGQEYASAALAHAEAFQDIDTTSVPGKYVFGGEEFDTEEDAEAAAEAACVHREAVAASPAGLQIDGYVFYEGVKTDAPSATAATATGKSEGYTNEYDSYDLSFGKEVTGNFGSLDQYFEYTVTIENITPGTAINVDLSLADVTPHESPDTKVTTAQNPAALTAVVDKYVNKTDATDEKTVEAYAALSAEDKANYEAKGKIVQKFYLHDGQYITLKELPPAATYAVVETDETDYVKTAGIAAGVGERGAYTDPTSGTIGEKQGEITGYTDGTNTISVAEWEALPSEADNVPGATDVKENYTAVRSTADQSVRTGYTNNRDVVTPTGIADTLMSNGPAILLLGAGMLGAGTFVGVKRRKKKA